MDQLDNLCISVYKAQKNICIVENALAVVVHLVIKQSKVEAIKQIKVIEPLIFNEVEAIRKLFNSFYFLLSSAVPTIKEAFYSIHVDRQRYSRTCREYFTVLSKMMSF